MAITYNNLQSAINTTTLSAYVPPSLTDSCLVVIVTSEDVGNNDPITGITFGGVSMVEGVIAHSVVSTNAQDVAIFYLVNPSTSSGNIVVTGSERQSIIAMTLNNVSQSSPIDDTGVREVSTGKDLAVSGVTTNANSFAVSGCVGDNTGNILTLTTGVKIISLEPTSAPSAAAVSTISTAGAYSHNWVCDDNLNRAASAIVAFNLETGGGGGISGTITQTAQSFTQSLSGSVVNSYTGTITQNTQSFTQSASGSITSEPITGVINQTVTAFTQSALGDVVSSGISGAINQTASAFTQSATGSAVLNISGVISQTVSAFTQSLSGTVAEQISGTINQTVSSFTMSAVGKIPASWVDKLPANTTWADQTAISTIWTDK